MLDGIIATFQATGDRYRVTLAVECKDGKNTSETEARRICTEALTAFPQVTSMGWMPD